MCLEVESKEKEMQMREEVHQREVKSLEEDLKKREEAGRSLQEKIDRLETSHQGSHDSLRTQFSELEKSNADLQMQVAVFINRKGLLNYVISSLLISISLFSSCVYRVSVSMFGSISILLKCE